MPSRNSKVVKSSNRVAVLSPLNEVGQSGELIVTKGDIILSRPAAGSEQRPSFTVIEPMAPPPPPSLKIGTPGDTDRVAFAIERADPDVKAGPDNVVITQIDNELTRRLARTAPLTIDAFEQIVDEVLFKTGTNLYAIAAEIDPTPRKVVTKNGTTYGNAILPDDHSDYLRNRPNDPLGYAIESYMADDTRHFPPIENVDDLVDFYVNGYNPDIRVHHEQRFLASASGRGSMAPFVVNKEGVDNLCLTCKAESHVSTYCECCRERNVENAEKQKTLPKKTPASMPSSFDAFHVCRPDHSDCSHMCKVAEKTRNYYSKGELIPQAFSYDGDLSQINDDTDFWMQRYRKSMSNLGHGIANLESSIDADDLLSAYRQNNDVRQRQGQGQAMLYNVVDGDNLTNIRKRESFLF